MRPGRLHRACPPSPPSRTGGRDKGASASGQQEGTEVVIAKKASAGFEAFTPVSGKGGDGASHERTFSCGTSGGACHRSVFVAGHVGVAEHTRGASSSCSSSCSTSSRSVHQQAQQEVEQLE